MPKAPIERKRKNYDNGPANQYKAHWYTMLVNGKEVRTNIGRSRKCPPTVGWVFAERK